MRYAPAVVLAVLAFLCFVAATPTQGGVNNNAIAILASVFFGLLALIAAAIAWFT